MSTKVTDLTELAATPDSTDVLHIVDVGDTSGGSAGTSKKIKVSNLCRLRVAKYIYAPVSIAPTYRVLDMLEINIDSIITKTGRIE